MLVVYLKDSGYCPYRRGYNNRVLGSCEVHFWPVGPSTEGGVAKEILRARAKSGYSKSGRS